MSLLLHTVLPLMNSPRVFRAPRDDALGNWCNQEYDMSSNLLVDWSRQWRPNFSRVYYNVATETVTDHSFRRDVSCPPTVHVELAGSNFFAIVFLRIRRFRRFKRLPPMAYLHTSRRFEFEMPIERDEEPRICNSSARLIGATTNI